MDEIIKDLKYQYYIRRADGKLAVVFGGLGRCCLDAEDEVRENDYDTNPTGVNMDIPLE